MINQVNNLNAPPANFRFFKQAFLELGHFLFRVTHFFDGSTMWI
ncbi:hypothetical protein GMES_1736 [Paraglaciecola mesophila KMM 241]|uniref:Uncharacterized protein n=1 Tax=Paraglaciecola mesophila KMM 241 TaxID=1128912 RepID=K6Z0U6_9ALTE|nr:hypothetical protein GMES_1736 [Paraglaciecola mesophila KMM 241]